MEVERNYFAASGAQFSNDKAQIYGEALDAMVEESDGLTPDAVVEAARLRWSPLHDYFEWDNDIAAEKHRIAQARHLLNHIRVEIVYDSDRREVQKKFFNVKVSREDEASSRRYFPIETIVNHEDYLRQVEQQALAEIRRWREKYLSYTRLEPIFSVIDQFAFLED